MTKHAIFWKWEKHSCVVVVPWNPWALNWYAKFKIVLNILHAHSRSISWKKVEKKEKESITEKRRDRIVYICCYTVAERVLLNARKNLWLSDWSVTTSSKVLIAKLAFIVSHTNTHTHTVIQFIFIQEMSYWHIWHAFNTQFGFHICLMTRRRE